MECEHQGSTDLQDNAPGAGIRVLEHTRAPTVCARGPGHAGASDAGRRVTRDFQTRPQGVLAGSSKSPRGGAETPRARAWNCVTAQSAEAPARLLCAESAWRWRKSSRMHGYTGPPGRGLDHWGVCSVPGRVQSTVPDHQGRCHRPGVGAGSAVTRPPASSPRQAAPRDGRSAARLLRRRSCREPGGR